MEKRACGKRPRKKILEQLASIRDKVELAIREYDLLKILFSWLVELAGFSGCSFQDTCQRAEWVLTEIEISFPGCPKLLEQTGKLREKLTQMLSFLQRLDEGFATAALEKGNTCGSLPHDVHAKSFPCNLQGVHQHGKHAEKSILFLRVRESIFKRG